MYFRLASSKGNTNQFLRTRIEETAGVLQVATKMTRRTNKTGFEMKNLRFGLIHRRNTSETKSGHEFNCSYKTTLYFLDLY